jgi:hypothetical protein
MGLYSEYYIYLCWGYLLFRRDLSKLLQASSTTTLVKIKNFNFELGILFGKTENISGFNFLIYYKLSNHRVDEINK